MSDRFINFFYLYINILYNFHIPSSTNQQDDKNNTNNNKSLAPDKYVKKGGQKAQMN